MTTTVDVGTEVIALERRALDRWGAGDPWGYVELFDEHVTYFDPVQERRIDGRAAMVASAARRRPRRLWFVDPEIWLRGARTKEIGSVKQLTCLCFFRESASMIFITSTRRFSKRRLRYKLHVILQHMTSPVPDQLLVCLCSLRFSTTTEEK